jgi:hypothetical protein
MKAKLQKESIRNKLKPVYCSLFTRFYIPNTLASTKNTE